MNRPLLRRVILAGACLVALSGCKQLSVVTRVPGLTWLAREEVALTPGEFQRLVYSSHLLTVLDDKPEVEAALLALQELSRLNSEASRDTLAKPAIWALEEWRKGTAGHAVPAMWRDEVLGRYFLKLCEAPELGERREVALNLLKVLMDRQDATDLLDEQEPRFRAGSEPLLAVASGPGERQALVENCMRRAGSDPVFRAAMDGLLRPETGVAVDVPPREVLAENPGLAQSPTMQELMRLSSSGRDGGVVIAMDKINGLFAAEVAVAQEAVAAHQALYRENTLARQNLGSHPEDATGLEARIRRHAEEQARLRGRVAAASAAAKKLSGMALEAAPEDAKRLGIVSNTLGLVGSSLSQFGGAANNPVGAVGGLFSLAGAGCQFALLFKDTGPPPEEQILESVKLVGRMISDLSEQMEDRFDRVDRSLVYVLRDLRGAVVLISDVGYGVKEIRKGLMEAQSSLNRLERDLDSYLTAGFGRELVQQINGDLGFGARTGEPMSWRRYRATDGPENAFHTWAVRHARDKLASPMPVPEDLEDRDVLAQLGSRPLERNLNYVKEFLGKRLGVAGLPHGPVPSVADWYAGANAYLRLAVENPQHFRRINPERLEAVVQTGAEIENYFRAVAFLKAESGHRVNRGLYTAVLAYYEAKLGAFHNALSDAEERSRPDGGLQDFAVSMWREWEARAPRTTVAETAVVGPYCLRRIPNDVKAIACGEAHSLALRANGTVVAWGLNRGGQCEVPNDLSDVVAVSAGREHSLALRKDGTIVAWGSNQYGQCEIPEHESVIRIYAGYDHSLALQGNGRVIAWGRNENGPCDVPEEALTGVIDIAAGGGYQRGDFSLALKRDGTLVPWGSVAVGATQRGPAMGRFAVPDGLADVVSISAGCGGRALAVKADGTVLSWPKRDYVARPVVRDGVTDIAAVAGAGDFTLGLKKDGALEVIAGSFDGTPDTDGFVAIAAGSSHALALRGDGAVVAWGRTWYGACGLDNGALRAVGIAGSGDNQLIIAEDGSLASPRIDVPSDLGAVVSAGVGGSALLGSGHYLALTAAGTVVAWGNNDSGLRNVPKGLSDVLAIAKGGSHCLALRNNYTVEAWGLNLRGQCNVPRDLDDAVAIAAGNEHSLALRADGTVVSWGGWQHLQNEVPKPEPLGGVVAIAAGSGHSLALKSDGTVVAWGANRAGQCNVPEGLSGVVAVTATGERSLALKADGKVVAWGRNDQGQCDFANGQSDVLAIAGGGYERDSLLVSAAPSGDPPARPLIFTRGEPPRAAMRQLRLARSHVLGEFDLVLNDSLNKLAGAKTLLESVIALGLPETLDRDDLLRSLLFGSEPIVDRNGARTLYEAEADRLGAAWRLRPSEFRETATARLQSLRESLDTQLDALEQSGSPQMQPMVAHTLLKLRLLSAAH